MHSDHEKTRKNDCGAQSLWGCCVRCVRSNLLAGASTWANKIFGAAQERANGILMYHRVADQPEGISPLTWNVTPQRLHEQLEGLLRMGFEPWPLQRFLDAHQAHVIVPRNVFVVTFDDGYANFFTQAYPVLKALEIPATLFLPTAYLDSDQPFPFDDWEAAGDERVLSQTWLPLSTDQCQEMLDSGWIELGAHTHTHQDFRDRPEEFAVDLQHCLDVLRDRFQLVNPSFAFPYGSPERGFAAESLVQEVQKIGLRCALTTERKLVRPQESPFHWGRFAAFQNDTANMLAARLNGWDEALRHFARVTTSGQKSVRGIWGK